MADDSVRQRQPQARQMLLLVKSFCCVLLDKADVESFVQGAASPLADGARPTNSLSSSYSDWPYQDNTDNIKSTFGQLVGEDGLLGLEQFSNLLGEIGLQAPSDVVLGLVEARASTPWALTLHET